jgi:hypothetical protein
MVNPSSSIARRRIFEETLRQGILGILQSSKKIFLIYERVFQSAGGVEVEAGNPLR